MTQLCGASHFWALSVWTFLLNKNMRQFGLAHETVKGHNGHGQKMASTTELGSELFLLKLDIGVLYYTITW